MSCIEKRSYSNNKMEFTESIYTFFSLSKGLFVDELLELFWLE